MNLVEPILFQCKLNPLATAICVPGSPIGSINYGQLERFIHNVGRAALREGMTPGNVAAILVGDSILHASLILGLMRLGITTLSLRGPQNVKGVTPDVILTDAPGRFSGPGTVLNVDQSWLDGPQGTLDCGEIFHATRDDVCRITLTSGSTGVPKGIPSSHQMLLGRIAHYTHSRGPRFAHCARLFCDLSIGTGPGFRYAMSLLSRGGTIYFLGPDPSDILQTFDLHKIGGMATTPYGLGEFLKYFEGDSAFELSLDFIICQGAMLSQALSRRARARMCQNLYSSYGAAETAGVAFGPASITESIPGAVGYIQPSVTVEAVDKSDNALPPGQDGLLRIRSIHNATAYAGDPEASRLVFRDGWFYSGDLGHLTAEGLLVVTGREKTALLIGGDTIAPETIETILTSFPGVGEAGVFAVDNNLGIAEVHALIVAKSPVVESALREHCARNLQNALVPVRYVKVDALPRGANGKLERRRLPELAATQPVAN